MRSTRKICALDCAIVRFISDLDRLFAPSIPGWQRKMTGGGFDIFLTCARSNGVETKNRRWVSVRPEGWDKTHSISVEFVKVYGGGWAAAHCKFECTLFPELSGIEFDCLQYVTGYIFKGSGDDEKIKELLDKLQAYSLSVLNAWCK